MTPADLETIRTTVVEKYVALHGEGWRERMVDYANKYCGKFLPQRNYADVLFDMDENAKSHISNWKDPDHYDVLLHNGKILTFSDFCAMTKEEQLAYLESEEHTRDCCGHRPVWHGDEDCYENEEEDCCLAKLVKCES